MKIKKYTCKQCGKQFTEKYSKYSSGDFCCKKCARVYSSTYNKEYLNKISSIERIKYYDEYFKNHPRICVVCGKEFVPKKIKHRRSKSITCSTHCSHILQYKSRRINGSNMGGGYKLNGHRKSYSGWYKGFHCDSTYELAYLIYCLDHNIDIKRCDETFEYELNGIKHTYHPDFIVDGIIIEIKSYDRGDVKAKEMSVDNKQYKLLFYEDIINEMNYVAETYNKKIYNKGQNNFYELYDNYKPKYILKCDYCGKEIQTNDKSRLKHKNHFCSLKCSGKYRASINHKK